MNERMQGLAYRGLRGGLGALAIVIAVASPGAAESIAPARDGTGTQVQFNGLDATIDGGQRSGDGGNLFHSFDRFSIDTGGSATFLADPQLRNIFGRVVGGAPSAIDGLLRVTGGAPNLVLMNPAGVLFGANAVLNVPADFTATTASAVGFGNGARWPSTATGAATTDWSSLLGDPIAYQLEATAGAIANAGHLAVGAGHSLTLLGRAINQGGRLTAPGGTIALVAVPGTSRVRLAPAGGVLGLEIDAAQLGDGHGLTLPARLPELLTAGAPPIAAGTVRVTGTVDGRSGDGAGGTVALLGDRVELTGATVDASGATGGGNLFVGGHWRGDRALPSARSTQVDGASLLAADALTTGPGGNIVVWADGDTAVSGHLSARGGSAPGDRGGLAEISGRQTLQYNGTVDLSAPAGPWGSLLLDPTNITIAGGTGTTANPSSTLLADGVLSAAEGGDTVAITAGILERIQGNIRLEATNDITVATGVTLAFTALEGTTTRNIAFIADADGDGSGAFSMDPTQAIVAPQSNLTISGASVTVGDLLTNGFTGPSGAITLRSLNGDLSAGRLDVTADADNGGQVLLDATGGNLTVDSILALATEVGNGGTLDLRSTGDIDVTGSILASGAGVGNGGTLAVAAGGNASLNEVVLTALDSGNGGTANLDATGVLDIGTLDLSSGTGIGGTGNLSAGETIALAIVTLGTELADQPETEETSPGSTLNLNTPGTIDWAGGTLTGGQDATIAIGGTEAIAAIDLGSTFDTGGSDVSVILAGDATIDTAIMTGGGPLTITSGGGLTIASVLDSSETTGTGTGIGGPITLTSVDDLTLDAEPQLGGTIAAGRLGLVSESGAIIAGNLDASSTGGLGGTLSLLAAGDITVGDLRATGGSQGGAIDLTSQQGSIVTGSIDVSSTNGPGGTIVLTAPAPTLDAETIDRLNAVEFDPPLEEGESILDEPADPDPDAIDAPEPIERQLVIVSDRVPGEIVTGDLDASGIDGGNISIVARTRYTGAAIDASGTSGNGGIVAIDPENDIALDTIDAQGGLEGGSVTLQADRFIRIGGTLTDRLGRSTSIATGGGTNDGSIQLAHGSTDLNDPLPFTVGDASINGAAGTLSSGASVIEPTEEFFGPVEEGTISLISTPIPDEIEPETILADLGDANSTVEAEQQLGQDLTTIPELEVTPQASVEAAIAATSQPRRRAEIRQRNSIAFPSINLSPAELDLAYDRSEDGYIDEYATYLDADRQLAVSQEEARQTLQRIEEATGVRPALLYVRFAYEDDENGDPADAPLQLMLITPNAPTALWTSLGSRREDIIKAANGFRSTLTNPIERLSNTYLAQAKLLYHWIVEPAAERLEALGIENIAFVMDEGLRTLPVAALHDGERFLVESYSVGLMPSLSLTDTRYVNLSKAPVLAMGASKFETLPPLPAVPEELALIRQLRTGETVLNDDFTPGNIKQTRDRIGSQIVHLATHAEFKPGQPSNSYIQLWGNNRISLDRVQDMGWNAPTVDLLTLSACRTAVGDRNAELGFAGLAVASGVRTVLASLWYVSDTGTFALMGEFYEQLKTAPIKAEALRQAQLAILRGDTRFEDGKLIGSFGEIAVPESLASQGAVSIQHPYFWSAFTAIGSPW